MADCGCSPLLNWEGVGVSSFVLLVQALATHIEVILSVPLERGARNWVGWYRSVSSHAAAITLKRTAGVVPVLGELLLERLGMGVGVRVGLGELSLCLHERGGLG